MNKLNQMLLEFELDQNFIYDDYFVSKSIILPLTELKCA